jgi:hypothetical protein
MDSRAHMKKHDFTLVFDLQSGELTDDVLDAFYEAGGDTALFAQSAGVFFARFGVQPGDVLEEIASAIDVIETAGVGAVVVRVEPDDQVSIGDIAERTERTNESIRLLVNGQRGPGGFPTPAARVGTGRSRLWRWADVVAWFHQYEPDRFNDDVSRFWAVIAAVNDLLRQRTWVNRSDPVAEEVRAALEPALRRACPVLHR